MTARAPVATTRRQPDGGTPALRRPDVLVALAVYAVTRAFAWVVISRAATRQLPSIWTGDHSGYLDMATLWDAQWYKIIATQGYPVPLPLDAAGGVQQNAWAFFPGFPYTVKAVMTVTGLSFSPAAVLTNLVLGACAVVVVLQLLQRVAGRHAGLAGVVLLCAFPSAPTLQIGYSEALGILLLALALLWLVERRYGLTAVVVLLLALSRPVVAPFAVVVLVHLVVRWRRRGRDPFGAAERVQVVALGLFAAASSLLWPAIVGWTTGVASAYAETQGTWRSGGQVRPFSQAFGIARLLLGEHGVLWLLLGCLLFTVVVLSPWGRRVGAELQAWLLAYPAYLLAATEPWTSTFRYLLLMFPLGAAAAGAVRGRPRLMWGAVVVLALVGLVLQVEWVDHLLVFVPPTDYPP
ncbi:MAG TPA: hypothetical protein VFL94_08870 [Actinomycetales bacterium]|nr:hypothetical protein [Actinomycetales bacterium]